MVGNYPVDVPSSQAVIVVRHGRTALNAAGRLRGHLDPALDQVGHQEVRDLALALAGYNVSQIVSSPLKRAVQTAQAIDREQHVGVTSDRRLIDRDYGNYAGLERAAVLAEWGSLDDAPGVEPAQTVTDRIVEVLGELGPRLNRGVTVLVSHDVVNGFLLSHLGMTPPIMQHTACWNLLICEKSGWRIAANNLYSTQNR
jgi:broad specificity phosphatase PhoE